MSKFVGLSRLSSTNLMVSKDKICQFSLNPIKYALK